MSVDNIRRDKINAENDSCEMFFHGGASVKPIDGELVVFDEKPTPEAEEEGPVKINQGGASKPAVESLPAVEPEVLVNVSEEKPKKHKKKSEEVDMAELERLTKPDA